jgi:nicotinamidase/pyrazinamidase
MILIDEDTQLDFLLPAGALYVPGAERLLPVYEKIFREVRGRGVPVLSSVDAHAENDPEFANWPAHCVQGTLGQQKAPCTLLPDRKVVPNRAGVELDGRAPQVIVEKQALDVFSNPNWEKLLALHPDDECAVIGVATDYCVRHVVEGLLERGRKVTLVTDGICGIDPAASRAVLEKAVARGARLTSSSEMWH